MKTPTRDNSFFFGLIFLGVSLSMTTSVRAETPAIVPVQGVLADSAGVGLTGDHQVVFSLWDAETEGTNLWTETRTITFTDGFFSTYLGAGDTPVDLTLMAASDALFLHVAVDGDEDLPRLRIGTAPYAAFAQYCGDATTIMGASPADLRYTAGDGLSLSGQQFSVNRSSVEDWARGVCYDTSLELQTALTGVYRPTSEKIPWDQLTNVPPLGSGSLVAGDGLLIETNTIRLDDTSCDAGYVLMRDPTNMVWECVAIDYADLVSTPNLSLYALSSSLAPVATSGAYSDLSGRPSLSTVAVSGNYNDLSNKPVCLPPQAGQNGNYLTTDGTTPSWSALTKATVGLGNVENTALSTWSGSSALTTLGTVASGTWNGSAIGSSYIGNLDAAKVTSGTFDNARINWAAPGNIGTTTPSSGAFTSLSANNGLSMSNGTLNLRPSGSGGTNGQVLTTDGAGNATWKAAPASSLAVSTQNGNYTITATDGLIVTDGGVTFTLPTAAAAGQGKTIYLYSKVSAITVLPPAGNTVWDANGSSHTNPATFTTYNGTYISDGVNTWYEVAK